MRLTSTQHRNRAKLLRQKAPSAPKEDQASYYRRAEVHLALARYLDKHLAHLCRRPPRFRKGG
jgi:hypothetical protein